MRFSVLWFAMLFATVICGSPDSAHADCTNPPGVEGKTIYNSVYNVPQVCNGADWIALGALNPSAGGSGCTSPTGTEGTIIHNSDVHMPQYCDGDDWRLMGMATVITGGGSCFDTWTYNDPGASDWRELVSSADGMTLAAVSYNNDNIYVSADGGATWTPRENARDWTGVTISADGAKLAATAFGGFIYTSTNGGVNWTQRATSQQWTSVASSADGTKLVATVDGDFIWTSANSGANWTERTASPAAGLESIASSADGVKLAAYASGSGHIYTSTNSGVNWTEQTASPTPDWADIASSDDGTTLIAGTEGGGFFTSTDSGVNWTEEMDGGNFYGVATSSDGTKLATVNYNGVIFTSADGGANWRPQASINLWGKIASSADGTKLAASAPGGIYTSDCSGGGGTPTCMNDATGTCILDATRANGDPQFTAANIATGVNVLGVTGSLAAGGPGCVGPADCPSIGNVCTDGSVFAGCSDSDAMFVTRCDAGQTYSGSCTGTQVTHYWGNSSSATGLRATGVIHGLDGQANTAALTNGTINGTGDSKTTAGLQPHNAAQYCADLSIHGKTDWYLPARMELDMLWINAAAIGNFLTDGSYWSSTEGGAADAWCEVVDGVSEGILFIDCPKAGQKNIRCARHD